MITPYKGRLGIVSTSRSGSTYFRRYLCNHYGAADSKSWLKHNLYEDIDSAEFASKPYLLKIIPHYVLNEKVYQEMPCIWLYRKDVLTQFLSHVTRLRTKINHITDIKDRPDIPDNSLIATVPELERFQLKQHEFWMLYEKYGHQEDEGVIESEPLISYEDFLDSREKIIEEINKWAWWDMYEKEEGHLKLTVPLNIMYRNKFKTMNKLKDGLVNRYCLVCTPRSGSFYVLKHLSETMNLDNGKEWFGRVKEVHYDKLKTSPVDIDHSVNEGLLSKKEISKRLIYLKNYPAPFIIKCMPFQLTNTIEEINLSYEERQDIATKILDNFSLIYLETRNKISQFCFDVISKNQDYVRRNFTSYDSSIRETPPNNSITATKDNFDSFMDRQNFVKDFRKRNWKDEPIIYYEDFIEYRKKNIIQHEDYKNIFINYKEIEEWFQY